MPDKKIKVSIRVNFEEVFSQEMDDIVPGLKEYIEVPPGLIDGNYTVLHVVIEKEWRGS